MQQVALRDWQVIEQLRLAANEGYLSKAEFKILLCPQLFIHDGDDDALPPGVERVKEPDKSTVSKEVGFKVDSEQS
jgi:hypothetical protein